MRGRGSFLVLGALWCATTALRCNFFQPATPEPPTGEAITPNYSDPDATLGTMKQAIEDKGRRNGQTVYLRAFADTTVDRRGFHAFFDPVSVARANRTPPDDWDVPEEGNFYNKFATLPVGASSSYLMEWGTEPYPGAPDDEEDPAAGTAVLRRHYEVTAALESGDGLLIAHGNADLYFVRLSSDRWAIVRWDDHEDDPMPNPEALSFGQRRLESQ